MGSNLLMLPSTSRPLLKLSTMDHQVLTIRKLRFSVARMELSSFKEQWVVDKEGTVAMAVELTIRHRNSNNHTSHSYSSRSLASESQISLQAQQVLACTVKTM